MIGRRGLVIVFRMTTDALRRKPEPVELSYGTHLVARIAVHHGMRANQREAVLVLVDVVHGHLPAVGVVT